MYFRNNLGNMATKLWLGKDLVSRSYSRMPSWYYQGTCEHGPQSSKSARDLIFKALSMRYAHFVLSCKGLWALYLLGISL
jgi:hypothetical protein